jgi:hypothetical protein
MRTKAGLKKMARDRIKMQTYAQYKAKAENKQKNEHAKDAIGHRK